MNKTARLKRLSRRLLATTCLTVAAASAAHAVTITESTGFFSKTFTTSPPPSELSNFATLTIPGSNTVNGGTDGSALDQYFTFDLGSGQAGQTFSYTLEAFGVDETKTGNFLVTDDGASTDNIGSTTPLTGFSAPFSSSSTYTTITTGTGLVPTDGNIVIAVQQDGEAGGISFSVTVSEPVAPEPGTFAEIGLGLAGAAVAMKRRFKTRKA